MVDPSSGSSWQLYVTTIFIHAWNLYYTINAVSSSGVVVTCTLERILYLALAVAEINIKFETNIKKV